jgi:NAD-dependent deacetylase
MTDPAVRKLAWRSRVEHPAWRATPNAGHAALARLECRGKLLAIVTQNIDGLHQRAGSSPDRVIEVHGTVHEVICMGCGWRGPMQETLDRVRCGEDDPPCAECGGILKSATISFGQALVPEVIERAMHAAAEADLFIAVGTSLQVYPVAGLLPLAKNAGARVVIANGEPTPMDQFASALLSGAISEVLPAICGPGLTAVRVARVSRESTPRPRRDPDEPGRRALRDAGHVALAPADHLAQHRQQIVAACGQVVLVACGPFLVPAPLHEAASLETPEALGEDVGGDPFGRSEEVGEPVLVVEQQVADDEQRPEIADEVERAGDRTRGPERARGRCFPSSHGCSVAAHLHVASRVRYSPLNLQNASDNDRRRPCCPPPTPCSRSSTPKPRSRVASWSAFRQIASIGSRMRSR